MIAGADKYAIFAPDYLLVDLSAALDSVPGMREARTRGQVVLSSKADAATAGKVIAIAPSLEQVARRVQREPALDRHPLLVASAVMAELAEVAERDGVTMIAEPELPGRLEDIVRAIANGIGLPSTRLATRVRLRAYLDDAPLSFDLEPLEFYRSLPIAVGATAWWPREIFRTSAGICPASIDIMGRPRTLCFGPYIHLPAGLWQAELTMDVSKDAATYDYGLEFCAGQKTSRVRFRPDGAGRQNAQVACRVAANAAVELRIWLLRAAFHGEFGLLGAKMTRLHPQSDAAGSSCESEYAS